MRGTRCIRFRSDPERTCKWTVCLTLDIIMCDWWILVAWSGLPVWHAKMQMIKASVEKQSLVVDDQSTACVAQLCVALIREPHTLFVNQKRRGLQGGHAFLSS